jgi:hypothetical protein
VGNISSHLSPLGTKPKPGEKNKIQNIRLHGNFYTIEVDNQGLLLIRNKTRLFEYKGIAVLRHIEVSYDLLSFEAHIIGDAIDLYPLIFQDIPFTVESRENKAVKIKNFIRIPRGITRVKIKKET